MKKLIAAAVLGLSAAAFVPATAYAADPVHTGVFNNIAVGGWDAVSFHDSEGVEGSKRYSTTHDGAEFRFASAENLARFEADPDRYAPAYGGYCAWAIAEGKLAPGNPRNANVVDGVLYLNFNDAIEEKWLADVPGFIERADQQWPEVLG
jgi:YHS domain-containing protein